jgi:hypothetical protein
MRAGGSGAQVAQSDFPKGVKKQMSCIHPKEVRAYRKALIGAERKKGVQNGKWFYYCAQCDAASLDPRVPLFDKDGIVRSSEEYGWKASEEQSVGVSGRDKTPAPSEGRSRYPLAACGTFSLAPTLGNVYRFMELRFSAPALKWALRAQLCVPSLIGTVAAPTAAHLFLPSGMSVIRSFGLSISDAEQMGAYVLAHPTPANADTFVHAVYHWGAGAKPFGKVQRAHGSGLGAAFLSAITAGAAMAPDHLLERVTSLKFIGVSYGSKLARMLDPQRCPTLDDVLEGGLGVHKSVTGYRFFCGELSRFMAEHGPTWNGKPTTAGTLEAGIFYMVRDAFRAGPPATLIMPASSPQPIRVKGRHKDTAAQSSPAHTVPPALHASSPKATSASSTITVGES